MPKRRPPPPPPKETLEAMDTESDRGCVLVGAAILEHWLAELLKAALWTAATFGPSFDLGDFEDLCDKLLESPPNPPLGSAAMRVHTCRGLGLINKQTSEALLHVFRCRNWDFAHWAGVSTLSDKHVPSPMNEFSRDVIYKHLDKTRDVNNPRPGIENFETPKAAFIALVAALLTELAVAAEAKMKQAQEMPKRLAKDLSG